VICETFPLFLILFSILNSPFFFTQPNNQISKNQPTNQIIRSFVRSITQRFVCLFDFCLFVEF
jgi:hypothetical protein